MSSKRILLDAAPELARLIMAEGKDETQFARLHRMKNRVAAADIGNEVVRFALAHPEYSANDLLMIAIDFFYKSNGWVINLLLEFNKGRLKPGGVFHDVVQVKYYKDVVPFKGWRLLPKEDGCEKL